MRKIGSPLALVNGKIEKNCIILRDEVSKKICNIAVGVSEMDSVASLEYFNGLVIPMVNGWEDPMTADKKKILLQEIDLRNIGTFTPEPLREGYGGDLLLLEKLDIKTPAFTPRTTIKKI